MTRMSWVVDTCLLIDVLEDDPDYGAISARLLAHRLGEGLTICPITYVEMAPAFQGSRTLQEEFLRGVGVDWHEPWAWSDTVAAFDAWQRHVVARRTGRSRKRPIADILIGAFALGRTGLLTRNAADFRPTFGRLRIEEP